MSIIRKFRKVPLVNILIRKYHLRRHEVYDAIRKEYRSIVNDHIMETPLAIPDDKWGVGEIEINNNCNLNCVMCNTQLSQRPHEKMDTELFERLILFVKEHGHFYKTLPLHTIGEPLINPLLEEYFKILRKHKVRIMLSTNAQNLHHKLHLLCEYADVVDQIRFSIDGATAQVYEKIRRPGKFDCLIRNLEAFTAMNNKARLFRDVMIDSIVSRDTAHQLAYHMQYYAAYVPMDHIRLHLLSGLSPDNTYLFEQSVLPEYIRKNHPCSQIFDGAIHILNDGRLTACCRDYEGSLVYGKLQSASFDEFSSFINSAKITGLREMHKADRIPPTHMCADCYNLDRRLTLLFDCFNRALVWLYREHWDVEHMQRYFDNFFEAFQDGIPSEEEFLMLLAY
jgi:pyruvate-formate lyase-activating enzyme